MDKLLEILAQNGPFAVMCGVLLWLFIRVLKRFDDLTKELLRTQIADTAAKNKLTEALEDVAETVEVLSSRDVSACRSNVDGMIERLDKYITHQKIIEAREEGRREATNPRIQIPIGEGDDKRGG